MSSNSHLLLHPPITFTGDGVFTEVERLFLWDRSIYLSYHTVLDHSTLGIG